MDTENQNRNTRVILVKKKKKKIPTTAPKVGIDRFDEYIEKSGLEPKNYQREGVAFCLRRECLGGGGEGFRARGERDPFGAVNALELDLGPVGDAVEDAAMRPRESEGDGAEHAASAAGDGGGAGGGAGAEGRWK